MGWRGEEKERKNIETRTNTTSTLIPRGRCARQAPRCNKWPRLIRRTESRKPQWWSVRRRPPHTRLCIVDRNVDIPSASVREELWFFGSYIVRPAPSPNERSRGHGIVCKLNPRSSYTRSSSLLQQTSLENHHLQ